MLKLRRIELLGFKSFSDKGEIVVNESGVTAIVGPNGCGKSNVSDAIAWVLGEQSAKSLRGEKMEDVIFNGSRNRSAMGMAEVTITLADVASEETVLPVTATETATARVTAPTETEVATAMETATAMRRPAGMLSFSGDCIAPVKAST